ncbi:MAG: hypothetical protein ACUVQ5_02180 [Candidatus Methanomethylicaceae archaeon]
MVTLNRGVEERVTRVGSMKALLILGKLMEEGEAVEAARKLFGVEALKRATIGHIFYPYWFLSTKVTAKMILGVTRDYEVQMMVDGVTGFAGYCARPDLITEELEDKRVVHMRVNEEVAFKNAREYLKRTFQRMKKLVMLKELEVEVLDSLQLYKQFWLIHFLDSGEKRRGVWALLDSTSGAAHYVVPRDIGLDVSSAR